VCPLSKRGSGLAEEKAISSQTVYSGDDKAREQFEAALAVYLLASLGGFLGRKNDGEPGTKSLWIGLQRFDDLTAMWEIMISYQDIDNLNSSRVQNPRYG